MYGFMVPNPSLLGRIENLSVPLYIFVDNIYKAKHKTEQDQKRLERKSENWVGWLVGWFELYHISTFVG